MPWLQGGHSSGCTSLCPTLPEDLDSLLGVDELSTFSLRETRLDLGGNSTLVGKHPILIRVLLPDDGEGLIEHLLGAHT